MARYRIVRIGRGQVPDVTDETKQLGPLGAEVVGIMSERDVIYCLRSDGAAMLDWTVERIMTAPAITVALDTEIMSALSLMTRRRIRHLPVVEAEALIGLVSIGDLVKFRMDKIEAEAAAMLSYIQSV